MESKITPQYSETISLLQVPLLEDLCHPKLFFFNQRHFRHPCLCSQWNLGNWVFSHSIPWEITKTRKGKEYHASICAGGFDIPCCLLRSDSTGHWWASKYSQTWPYDVTQVSVIFLNVDHTKSCLFLKASWFREGCRINIRLESCSTCCHRLSMNSLAIESLAFP